MITAQKQYGYNRSSAIRPDQGEITQQRIDDAIIKNAASFVNKNTLELFIQLFPDIIPAYDGILPNETIDYLRINAIEAYIISRTVEQLKDYFFIEIAKDCLNEIEIVKIRVTFTNLSKEQAINQDFIKAEYLI